MYCSNCGKQLEAGDKFCWNCGKKKKFENGAISKQNFSSMGLSKNENQKDTQKLNPQTEVIEVNSANDKVKKVFYSEKEILEKIQAKIQDAGLCYKQTVVSVGESTTTGGGVLLGSDGDVFVGGGGGKSEQTKFVWNPFLVKENLYSPYAIKVTVIETSKISKLEKDINFEGRNLRIQKEEELDLQVSLLGCLLGLIPGLLAILFIVYSIVGTIILGLIAWGVYKIGESINKWRVRNNKPKYDELKNKVNKVLEKSYYDLIKEPF